MQPAEEGLTEGLEGLKDCHWYNQRGKTLLSSHSSFQKQTLHPAEDSSYRAGGEKPANYGPAGEDVGTQHLVGRVDHSANVANEVAAQGLAVWGGQILSLEPVLVALLLAKAHLGKGRGSWVGEQRYRGRERRYMCLANGIGKRAGSAIHTMSLSLEHRMGTVQPNFVSSFPTKKKHQRSLLWGRREIFLPLPEE